MVMEKRRTTSGRRRTHGLIVPLVTLVALVAACGLLSAFAPGPGTRAAGTGAILVKSEPSQATVTVDNTVRGVTPLQLKDVAAGSHRIVVSKAGYLENLRIVDVNAGGSHAVEVKLTPHAGATGSTSAQATASPQKKKGNMLKWLLPVAGGGAVGAVLLVRAMSNKPPVAGTVSVSPTGAGLVGATNFSITSQGASDPNGDPLTYSWSYGDSGSGTGANVNHVFNSAGTYNDTVTVSDGKASATASATVTVRDLTGTWVGNIYTTSCGTNWLTWTLTQSGSTLTGSHYDTTNGFRSLTATVSDPMNVRIVLSSGVVYTGSVNSAFTQISGTVTGYYGGTGNFAACR